MIRNIVLLVSTAALLLMLFFGYSQLVRDPQAADTTNATSNDDLSLKSLAQHGEGIEVANVTVPPGGQIEFVRYDERTGRPTDRIKVRDWKPVPGSKSEVAVDTPELTMLMPGGMVAAISADSGQITVDRVQNTQMRPKLGWMRGHCRIVIDRGARTDDAERTAERVIIAMDQMDFDLELGELKTAGAIRVESADVEISGTGLDFSWNQVDNRVQKLLLARGEQLVLYGDSGLLGGPAAAEPGAGDTTGKPSTAPATPPQRERTTTYECTLTGSIVADQFHGNERVGGLTAGELRLLFDVGGKAANLLDRGRGGASSQPTSRPADQPRDRLVVRWNGPLSLLPIETSLRRDKPRRRLEARGPLVTLARGDSTVRCGRLEYYDETRQVWLYPAETGRVDFTMGEGLNASSRSVYIDRTNNIVKLLGDVAFESRRKNEPGSRPLGIRASEWAELQLETTPEPAAAAAVVQVVPVAAQENEPATPAHTHGVARRVTDSGAKSARAARGAGDEELLGFTELRSATFVGNAVVNLSDQTLAADRLETRFRPRQGDEPLEALLTSAVAAGNAQLKGAREVLTCDEMRLSFANAADGGVYPSDMDAIGNVLIAQEQSRVTGNRVRARMAAAPPKASTTPPHDEPHAAAMKQAPPPDDPSARPGAVKVAKDRGASRGPAAFLLKSIEITGNARLRDPRNKVSARGQVVTANFDDGGQLTLASVTGVDGQMGLVQATPYTVRGQQINIDRAAQSLQVDGRSRLRMLSQRSLQGEQRDRPTAVTVESNKWLQIDGLRNVIFFEGAVVARTGEERLEADSLTLLLEDAAVVQKPPRGPSPLEALAQLFEMGRQAVLREPPAAKRELFAVETRNDAMMRRKEPVRLTANNATVISEGFERGDPTPVVFSSLSAAVLEVEIAKRVMHTTGETSLLLTNRRMVDDTTTERDTLGLPSALITKGPSQTAMSCKGSMVYALGEPGPQRRDNVIFEGGVIFAHRAGAEMVNLEQMLPSIAGDKDALARLKSRNTYMECQRLECGFNAGGDAPASVSISPHNSLRLTWLIADRDVYLRDVQGQGIRTVNANRIEFDRALGVVRVFGSPKSDARIYFENPKTGQLDVPAVGESFIIDLNNNTVRTGQTMGEFRRP